ncbi:MAG: tRNA guanosine(34) transglycosylase Tgt [Rhodospirillales bacterium]|nr:tRNA guanosine(34) transglycosylase Tgt [Rhodospirillales bacterium]
MTAFGFSLLAQDGQARRGRLTTAHGKAETPAFMAVGTAATVKGLTPAQVASTGTQIVLGNTYHLMLRPTAERVAELGGLHRFMDWNGPILTDSGGYQVMSLAKLRKISDEGVAFHSHLDGARLMLSPERAVEIQQLLGSDITMVLDQCVRLPAAPAVLAGAMERSHRWAERCRRAFNPTLGHALFGILQGGDNIAMRHRAAAALTDLGFDGYALGGLAVGEPQEIMFKVVEETAPALPQDQPRYLMGVGKPSDLVGAVLRGIDMFDCVLPTRSGRTGQAFTARGSLNIRNARHRADPRPLDPECSCLTCARFSRAYLHHLTKAGEMLGPVLMTLHNLTFYQTLMARLRDAIAEGRAQDFAAAFAESQARGDLAPLA